MHNTTEHNMAYFIIIEMSDLTKSGQFFSVCLLRGAYCPGMWPESDVVRHETQRQQLWNWFRYWDIIIIINKQIHLNKNGTSLNMWPYPPKRVTPILFMKFGFLHTCKKHLFSFQMIPKLCKSAYRFKSYW